MEDRNEDRNVEAPGLTLHLPLTPTENLPSSLSRILSVPLQNRWCLHFLALISIGQLGDFLTTHLTENYQVKGMAFTESNPLYASYLATRNPEMDFIKLIIFPIFIYLTCCFAFALVKHGNPSQKFRFLVYGGLFLAAALSLLGPVENLLLVLGAYFS